VSRVLPSVLRYHQHESSPSSSPSSQQFLSPLTICTHVPAWACQEPARPPSPEPTIAVYENIESLNAENHHGYQHHNPTPSQWSTISVRLVGTHPLWGHYLYVYLHVVMNCSPTTSTSLSFSCFFCARWNAARALARFLQCNPKLYAGQTVLELGAGGGLPGLIAAKCGAQKVRVFLLYKLNALFSIHQPLSGHVGRPHGLSRPGARRQFDLQRRAEHRARATWCSLCHGIRLGPTRRSTPLCPTSRYCRSRRPPTYILRLDPPLGSYL